jgi:cytosine/adenosine deaminase-related metal-dependent hydrolase
VTEANLGDGMFGLQRLLAEGGGFGVGSDSNVRISAADELRTLEYGHRLTFQSRNIFADAERSTGRLLFEAASAGAARAVGLPMGAIAAGNRADFAVLDRAHPTLALAQGDAAIDAWLFAADNGAVKTVYAAGKALVQNGRHIAREAIVARYAKAMAALG